jgi:hypothetical protein
LSTPTTADAPVAAAAPAVSRNQRHTKAVDAFVIAEEESGVTHLCVSIYRMLGDFEQTRA